MSLLAKLRTVFTLGRGVVKGLPELTPDDDPIEFFTETSSVLGHHAHDRPSTRTYMAPIVEHFFSVSGAVPTIIDIGGYLGRFSIESALLLKTLGFKQAVYCFEPGPSRRLIAANLLINHLTDSVELISRAASNHSGSADFSFAEDALISGRFAGSGRLLGRSGALILGLLRTLQTGMSKKSSGTCPAAIRRVTVETMRMDEFIAQREITDPLIVKIDTEGFEPKVMEGFGPSLGKRQAALIIEFWPHSLSQKVTDLSYEDYLQENFLLFDIKQALKPERFARIEDLRGYARHTMQKGRPIDLLCLSASIGELEQLAAVLSSLGQSS